MKEDKCEWPGCGKPALCSSGNVGGGLVCREHFRVTNGKARHTAEERRAMREIIGKQR